MTEGQPVASGPGRSFTASIANGAQNSGVIDLGTFRLAMLIFGAFTGTSVNFEAGTAADNLQPLYKDDGTLYSPTVAANRAVAVDLALFAGARYVRVKSGSAEGADRTIALSALA